MNPFSPPPETKWNIISLGAGVQSSTMALMAAAGEITPMPDAAVFADTGAEPSEVYRWLDWLEKQLPYPVVRVMKGNGLTDAIVNGSRSGVPAFCVGKDGEPGITMRTCTGDFKVSPIRNKVKELCGVGRSQKDVTVTQWIGISFDEMRRMKLARDPWQQNRWPLVELRMRRADCLEWMRQHGYHEPPRSACVYCPFHSNAEWQRLKTTDPESFAEAVRVEKLFQDAKARVGRLKGTPFFHRSLQPLDTVDFRSAEDFGQGVLDFNAECEGMCGV